MLESVALAIAVVSILAGFVLYLASEHLAGSRAGRLAMLLGVLCLPLVAMLAGVTHAYHESSTTRFCLSCHEMQGHGKSMFVDDPQVLPAVHYQSRLVDRDRACFECHTNYAMFGDLRAKVDGLRHVWVHYMEEPPAKLELYEPYPNTNCLHCHEDARSFAEAVPHRDQLDALYRGERSCLECHEQGHARELVEEGALWLPDL
ncbi:MAG: NapC/NirT family cytochrome c [Myxococcales bacterium]|nr:NapC/NirT family cytochrome c [Myxococcales bacterium]